MSYLRVQVTLPFDTAIPRDAAVNTFHFLTDNTDTDAAERTDIVSALTALYGTIDQFLSPNIAASGSIKFYDLEDAEPRLPLQETALAITPGTAPYPNELAIAVSFQGQRISGQLQRRRRGRVFIGPLGGASIVTDATGDVEISSADRTTIANAFGALLPEVPGSSTSGIFWCVYSRATHTATGSLDAAFVPLTDGWVDNRFDVQRRRGTAPTARTVFS